MMLAMRDQLATEQGAVVNHDGFKALGIGAGQAGRNGFVRIAHRRIDCLRERSG